MKIILEKSKCIGCGTCQALCPKYFELKDGKAHLKDSKNSEEKEEIETNEIDCAKEAVDACPVQCIHIIIKPKT